MKTFNGMHVSTKSNMPYMPNGSGKYNSYEKKSQNTHVIGTVWNFYFCGITYQTVPNKSQWGAGKCNNV